MANAWIHHVKKYAKEHNMEYRDALKDPKCRTSYKAAPSAAKPKASGKGKSKRASSHKMNRKANKSKKIEVMLALNRLSLTNQLE